MKTLNYAILLDAIPDSLLRAELKRRRELRNGKTGPVGKPSICPRCQQEFPTVRARKYHACPASPRRKGG